jgi:hypothetical protein
MTRLAAHHDIGLASELCAPPNRAISLTNKIFVYLLAGIPVLMSDTPAQRKLGIGLGEAARVVNLADPVSVADVLESWARDKQALAAAKCAAWHLAQTRFNWDIEKERFLTGVKITLSEQIGNC